MMEVFKTIWACFGFFFVLWCPVVAILVAVFVESLVTRFHVQNYFVKIGTMMFVQVGFLTPAEMSSHFIGLVAPWWYFLSTFGVNGKYLGKYTVFFYLYFLVVSIAVEGFKCRQRNKRSLKNSLNR